MDVHDVGNTRTPLAPGMVLTVEPGIYLLREGPGVRIEDEAAGGDRKPDAAWAAAGNSGGGLRASAF
jgi:Xaa-Pro aminopeptidase